MVRKDVRKGTRFNTTFSLRCLVAALVYLSWQQQACAVPCQDVRVPADEAALYDRRKGLEYTRTSEYRRQFKRAIDEARRACIKHRGENNLAIVADIDETLLDNRQEIKRHPDFTWAEFKSWVAEAKAPVLKPTARFLSWARKEGFAIFLVTGRDEDLRLATIVNLVRCRVPYDGLYMRATGDARPAAEVKTAHRQTIETMGFKIVVNIGDQYTDLIGGHADDCEKLPNRMYFVE